MQPTTPTPIVSSCRTSGQAYSGAASVAPRQASMLGSTQFCASRYLPAPGFQGFGGPKISRWSSAIGAHAQSGRGCMQAPPLSQRCRVVPMRGHHDMRSSPARKHANGQTAPPCSTILLKSSHATWLTCECIPCQQRMVARGHRATHSAQPPMRSPCSDLQSSRSSFKTAVRTHIPECVA